MPDELKVVNEPANAKAAEPQTNQSTEGVVADPQQVTAGKTGDDVDVELLKREAEEAKKLRDELNKAKMDRNRLENELEKAAQAGDTSEYERIIEELRAEKEALAAQKKAEEQEKTVNEYHKQVTGIFEQIVNGYPKEVQEAAMFSKDRFGIDSIVGEAQYTFEAEKNIKEFLDGLNGRIAKQDDPKIIVDATNPGMAAPVSDSQLIAEQLEKPIDKRDFSKIIGMRIKRK